MFCHSFGNVHHVLRIFRYESHHMEPTPLVMHDLAVKNSRILRKLNRKSNPHVNDSTTRQQVFYISILLHFPGALMTFIPVPSFQQNDC